MRPDLAIPGLMAQALEGQDRAVGLLISEIEGENPRRVIDLLVGRPRDAHIIGITGPPGAGKSTLTGRLASSLIENGARVAVIAVDPSSPFTGGALLGDRVRMEWSPGARPYMRSMATRGAGGGLAGATEDSAHLLSCLGFSHVLIETVGAGQNDLAIAGIADTVLVVSVPGLGDSVQAEKAGMYEVADVHVINKSDRPGAKQLAAELRSVTGSRNGWEPPVLLTTATRGLGVDELRNAIGLHHDHLLADGRLEERRRKRAGSRLVNEVQAQAIALVRQRVQSSDQLARLADEIVKGTVSLYQAIDQLSPRYGDGSPAR